METPMKKIILALTAVLGLLAFGPGHAAWAQSESGYYSADDEAGSYLLTPEELEYLVAPIALYPDPLIAQILPAATFVDQIDEAARYVRQFGGSARIDYQAWDVSVKALAHYPDVLFMMDQRYDWTVALGQAFIDQPQDVMDAIQTLRADARAQGNLFSTREQQVIVESGYIRIVPVSPEYVYVPVYDPQVVYVERYNPSYPLITFGIGLSIGAWLSRDCNWRERRVYYHGWRGSGWVSRARPHIHDRGGIYINRRADVININNRVLQHDTRIFRQQLRTDTIRRREQRGLPAAPDRTRQPRPGRTEQPRPGRIEQPRPGRIEPQRAPGAGQQRSPEAGPQRAPAIGQQRPPVTGGEQRPAESGKHRPAASGQIPAATIQQPPAATGQRPPARSGQQPPAATVQQPPARSGQSPATASQPPAAAAPKGQPASVGRPGAAPTVKDVFRGRDVQKVQPASNSGYGGYGSSKDATIYRERGQTSRENMRQINRPAPAQAPAAPAVAPAPRPAVTPGQRPAHQRMERPASGAVPSTRRPDAPPAARPAAPERQQQQRR
jgi:hypothetical protein